MVYTGKNTLTGGRLLRLKKYFTNSETFMLTYGDGVTSQNIKKLVQFHKSHKKIATMINGKHKAAEIAAIFHHLIL